MTSSVDMLREINSATKYPAIPTYHYIEKGFLREDSATIFPPGQEIIGTEKVDGTNARMIFLPVGDYFIGSREELLYAGGDICFNNDLGIVDTLKNISHNVYDLLDRSDHITVVYGEVYGGRIGGQWKNYTTDPKQTGFRVFDVATVDPEILELNIETISGLRERNAYQTWYSESDLQHFSQDSGLPLTPRLFSSSDQLPTTLVEMYDFLSDTLPYTRVNLADSALSKPEGIVLRTSDRRVIAKARFEDYRKTLQRIKQSV